jgi:MFS superfamily sulfate permease-like transporter
LDTENTSRENNHLINQQKETKNMTLLNVLYWVLLVLALLALFAPSELFPRAVPGLIWIVLFVLIGLKSFRTPIN